MLPTRSSAFEGAAHDRDCVRLPWVGEVHRESLLNPASAAGRRALEMCRQESEGGAALRWEIDYCVNATRQYHLERRAASAPDDPPDSAQRRWMVDEVIAGEERTLGVLERLCSER